jgi:hypothetical protein
MPYSISVSRFSFIQFDELDTITACNWTDTDICLPVYLPGDIAFQFVLTASTEDEADALCTIEVNPVIIGHVERCSDVIAPFSGVVTRYRIGPLQVLYHWPNGITTLGTMEIGQCFRVGVEAFDQFFCSNCFQRIGSDCHTSVIEYSGNDNSFGFNYCAGEAVDEDATDCDPLILEFVNQTNMTIAWTAYLQSLYGNTPTVTVWTYDGGELVQAGQVIKFDTYPPTEIRIDMGGPQSGVVKIMR